MQLRFDNQIDRQFKEFADFSFLFVMKYSTFREEKVLN